VLKLVKKLSNEVVDLEKNTGEGSSHRKPFWTFHKKENNQPKLAEASNINLNIDEFGMDIFFSYHQTNHSEKTYPQWIIFMNLGINQLLEQQSTTADQPQETTTEATIEEGDDIEESALFLWEWSLEFSDESRKEISLGGTHDTKTITKYYNLRSKGPVTDTTISAKFVSVPRKISPPVTT